VIDAKIEMKIVTGMIVSTEFLEGIVSIFRNQLQIPSTNRVAGWCSDYFKQYGLAPNTHIKDIFKQHSKELESEEKFLIEEFLDRLSKRYKKSKKFNVPYVLDIAEEYLRTIALEELHSKLGTALEKGTVTRAENIVKKFERAVRPETKGINPFSEQAIVKAFEEEDVDKLFRFPGKLGEVVGDFEREYLTAFFGIRGTGKTWWLLWTGLLGVFAGYNVIFVSLEMSEKQIIKRIHQYLNAKPTRKGKIELPVFYDEGEDNDEQTTTIKEQRRKKLSIKIATSKMKDIDESSLIKANFKLLTYPSGTTTVSDLKAHLHNMEYYEDFIPDVIITDYADKFKAEDNGEMRHRIGSIWRAHKALAQERKCLVLTASQTNTARSGRDIGVGSAAESMEKENESDLLIALNQKPEEKQQGLMRVKITKHRHSEYDLIKEVFVTQCYSIGKPYLDSRVNE
jgi:hypothetical protein|tara:strand:+ start:86 stop:1447 length:1362 start_codon:yes stop_codon:yes gene_type:complete